MEQNPYLSQIQALEQRLAALESEEAQIAYQKSSYLENDSARISLEQREADILREKAQIEQQIASLKEQAIAWERSQTQQ